MLSPSQKRIDCIVHETGLGIPAKLLPGFPTCVPINHLRGHDNDH